MNKLRIAQSFSRAAHTYDRAAHLQREIGNHLFTLIPVLSEVNTVVDLGCGTGFFTQALNDKFPRSQIIGLDIAKGMLDFAQAQCHDSIQWVCADAEALPFSDDSVNFIFSSLAIQWCDNLHQALTEIKRVLQPGGMAVLSTLGSQTLNELKQSWEVVDAQPHVNQFLTHNEIKNTVQEMQFSTQHITSQQTVLKYHSPMELMRELKELGAHEVTQKQSAGLMGKNRFQSFLKGYQSFKKETFFPATYEIIYITIQK